jgi:hypothetical protein
MEGGRVRGGRGAANGRGADWRGEVIVTAPRRVGDERRRRRRRWRRRRRSGSEKYYFIK